MRQQQPQLPQLPLLAPGRRAPRPADVPPDPLVTFVTANFIDIVFLDQTDFSTFNCPTCARRAVGPKTWLCGDLDHLFVSTQRHPENVATVEEGRAKMVPTERGI